METEHVCRDCGAHENVHTYVDTASGEKLVLCTNCGDTDPVYVRMSELRTCYKCGDMGPCTRMWIEIDPRTNKRVSVCDPCYHTQNRTREHVIMHIYFTERCTTLRIIEYAYDTYMYEATYHMFEHTQRERAVSEFALSWIRDAFNAMNHVYDDLSVCATETYMDCDTCNQ